MNVDISTIKLWFERAVPNPTDKSRAVQLGVHYEEVDEMLSATGDFGFTLGLLAHRYKRDYETKLDAVDRTELLDSLCDQIVTAIGVAHMFGLDISGALSEVNASNFSKFDSNGQPVFDANGKVSKGPNYRKPDLTPFV